MINLTIETKDTFYLLNKYSNAISKLEAEILLCHLFNCEKIDLYVKDFSVNEGIEEQYDFLVKRRLNGEPIQYITGWTEFMGLRFIVNKDVFIPRPETELLVNEAFTAYSLQLTAVSNIQILDLCTGSGNIAISLANHPSLRSSCVGWGGFEVVGTDISGDALKIAEENAVLNKVSDRVKFYKGDLFNALVFDKNLKFDIIICNPPYIKEEELAYLQKEVQREPRMALNGRRDGLEFYRRIACAAPNYLKKNGVLLLEIGFGHVEDIKEIFNSTNRFEIKKIVRDFAGIERITAVGTRNL